MIHFLSHLKENPVFQRVSDHILLKLLMESNVKTLASREMLFSEEDDQEDFYFIVKGIIKGYFTTNNNQFVSLYFKKGEVLMNLKSPSSDSGTGLCFEAIMPVTVIYIDKMTYYQLMVKYPSIGEMYTLNFAASLRKYEERLRLLLCHSAKERYKSFIEEFEEELEHFTQRDIASYLSITPETLSRIKKTIDS